MCKVAHRHLAFLLDARQPGSFVVHLEGEDAVLVGRRKGRRVDGAVAGDCGWGEREALKGREHAEFELERVGGRWEGEGCPVCARPLGDFDGEVLRWFVSKLNLSSRQNGWRAHDIPHHS